MYFMEKERIKKKKKASIGHFLWIFCQFQTYLNKTNGRLHSLFSLLQDYLSPIFPVVVIY